MTDDLHIVDLPRHDPFVSFYSQVAKSVAGCFVCDRPIAKGTHRLSLVITLPEPRVDKGGNTRRTERFNAHPGCLSFALEGVMVATGWDCWDCGAQPMFKQGHPWKCFTTSRFAPGALCTTCAQRGRWKTCEHCMIFFPHYMVSATVETVPVAEDGLLVEDVVEVCEYCAARLGVKTLFQAKREQEEFEALRAQIAAGKVFRQ